MWAHLQRQGVPVARCTVERLMRATAGTARRGPGRYAPPSPTRPPSGRRTWCNGTSMPARPDQLWVADFTYVPIDGRVRLHRVRHRRFRRAHRRLGMLTEKNTAFVESAIRQATAFRSRQGHPLTGDTIHHSDAGSQYTAMRFGETLMLAGLTPSIGTVGDALDNALAETTIGLYKTECVREDSPFRTGRSSRWPTSKTSPRPGCTGTTTPASCTASADAHPPKPRPTTTPGCKPATPSAVR